MTRVNTYLSISNTIKGFLMTTLHTQPNHQHILLINDLPGYGKVALAAMLPILSHMGFHVYNLPTALISNTLNYGKFSILDTTSYMKDTLAVWKQLDFSFHAICTGFIASEVQASIVFDLCAAESKKGTKIFVDPIMGDEGHLYNGMTNQTIQYMQKLISVADYIIPNMTEALLLAKNPCHTKSLSKKESINLINTLRVMGAKSIVITSANVEDIDCVIGYDNTTNTYFNISYTPIPMRFSGTGDIFSSIFTGHILRNKSVADSAKIAMDLVKEMIVLSQKSKNAYKGLPLELYLSLL